MSVRLMADVWDLNIPTNRKMILLKLADHGHDDGTSIYPAIKSVSRRTGVGVRTIKYALGEWVENGVLVVMRPGGGRKRPTEYFLDINRAKEVYPMPAEPDDSSLNSAADAPFTDEKGSLNSAADAPFNPGKGASDDTKGASGDTKGATALHPNLKQPSGNNRARAPGPARATWAAALDELRSSESYVGIFQYLEGMTPIDIDDDKLVLRAETRFFRDMIEGQYREEIEEVIGRRLLFTIGTAVPASETASVS